MNPKYSPIAKRAGLRCEYCLAPQAAANFPLEVEHIIPVVGEGGDESSNLALACHSCNLFKGASRTGRDPESNKLIRLFHPRTDQWSDHFEIVPATFEVRGRTDVGRATVERLRFNSQWQLTARKFWIRAGLYP